MSRTSIENPPPWFKTVALMYLNILTRFDNWTGTMINDMRNPNLGSVISDASLDADGNVVNEPVRFEWIPKAKTLMPDLVWSNDDGSPTMVEPDPPCKYGCKHHIMVQPKCSQREATAENERLTEYFRHIRVGVQTGTTSFSISYIAAILILCSEVHPERSFVDWWDMTAEFVKFYNQVGNITFDRLVETNNRDLIIGEIKMVLSKLRD